MVNRKIASYHTENGFSYIEVLIAIAILGFIITPIFSMFYASMRNYTSAEKYYEATVMSQNMLETVKAQMSNTLSSERQLQSLAANPADPVPLLNFLGIVDAGDISSFNTAYKTSKYDYEVYIKAIGAVATAEDYIISEAAHADFVYFHQQQGTSLLLPVYPLSTDVDFVDLSISTTPTNYMSNFESTFGDRLVKQIVKYKYHAAGGVAALEFVSSNPTSPSPLYVALEPDRLIVDDATLLDSEVICIDINLSHDIGSIGIENKSKATLVVSAYKDNNSINPATILFPINHPDAGDIIIEGKSEEKPKTNYLVKIVVRNNGTILKQLVDLYAHDYRF